MLYYFIQSFQYGSGVEPQKHLQQSYQLAVAIIVDIVFCICVNADIAATTEQIDKGTDMLRKHRQQLIENTSFAANIVQG